MRPPPVALTRLAGLAAAFFILCAPTPSAAWQTWTDETNSPGARDGHSLHIYNDTLILFGGRNNEIRSYHHPMTFETERVNGSLRFKSYYSRSVVDCGQLTPDECYNITIGRFYNDVWTYPLTCKRGWDTGCVDDGWAQLESGAPLGGCTLINNREVCTHPQERFGHASAVFSDGRLLVYGGFSRLCEDYCSDIWSLDLRACTGRRAPPAPVTDDEVFAPGLTSRLGDRTAGCKWRLMQRLNRTSPGRRWRTATAQADDWWFFFGGHRLWHGFSPTNSLANRWRNKDKFDYGGVFDDLWLMRYNGSDASVLTVDPDSLGPNRTMAGVGGFQQLTPRESCYKYYASLDHEARHDVVCTLHWPPPRAHAALAAVPFRHPGNRSIANVHLYLHGGYAAPLPYPQTLGRGSGPGVASVATDGPSPFPSHPYMLGDLWRYEYGTGLWEKLNPVGVAPDGSDGPIPSPRFGHSLTLAGSVLLLFGGRRYSDILGDTWLFNTASGKWVRKASHVHPLYPASCTSDVAQYPVPPLDSGGWPSSVADLMAVDARPNTLFPGDDGMTGVNGWDGTLLLFGERNASVEVVTGAPSTLVEATRGDPLDGQEGRWTDPIFVPQPRRQAPGWDGCRDRPDDRTDLPAELLWLAPSQRLGHAAAFSDKLGVLFMYGGEAYVEEQPANDEVTFPSADVADLWMFSTRNCANNCSFHGSCDYGHCRCDDGWYGLDCSNATCPGDFCDYDEGSFTTTCVHCASLPHVHGLRALLRDPAVNRQHAFRLVFMQRLLDDGAWDDAATDPEGDVYQPIARKGPLNYTALAMSDARTRLLFDGTYDLSADELRWPRGRTAALEAAARLEHGQCNGFGQCVCRPPFLGEDCSVKGCNQNCFGRGVCVVEYPVARCDCLPPYGGVDCSILVCPNNCSFPNGVCQKDGTCDCAWASNPYNRSQMFAQYGGPDCSWAQPFAGGESWRVGALTRSSGSVLALGLAVAAVAVLALLPGGGGGGREE